LSARVVGNAGVANVDGNAFDRDVRPPLGLPERDDTVRLNVIEEAGEFDRAGLKGTRQTVRTGSARATSQDTLRRWPSKGSKPVIRTVRGAI
jgi:alkylhydroperoxidase family enzyme